MFQVIVQHFQKIHDLGTHFLSVADQSEHDHTKGILQLRVLIELVQDHIGIGVSSQFNADAHTFPVGMVADGGDAVNLLIPYQFGNFLYQTRLIYHIGQLCNNNLALSVWHGLNIGHRADSDLAPAGTVSFLNSPGP